MEDGRVFRIFRRVTRRNRNLPAPEAAFLVRFTPRGTSITQNIRFSRLPMIFLLGFPGFRAKYWTVEDGSGACQGIYDWDTISHAERYASSIALRFLSGRSEPGSVSFRVIDQRASRYRATLGPKVRDVGTC
jgi:hypothetical protein